MLYRVSRLYRILTPLLVLKIIKLQLTKIVKKINEKLYPLYYSKILCTIHFTIDL